MTEWQTHIILKKQKQIHVPLWILGNDTNLIRDIEPIKIAYQKDKPWSYIKHSFFNGSVRGNQTGYKKKNRKTRDNFLKGTLTLSHSTSSKQGRYIRERRLATVEICAKP